MYERGYLVYRLRGRCYVLYSQSDDHQSINLGYDIVDAIPADYEGYQKWREAIERQLQQWENVLLTKVLAIPQSATNLLGFGRASHYPDQEPRYKIYLHHALESSPSYQKCSSNDYIQWIYTIDLDYNLFIINDGAYLELSKIPRLGEPQQYLYALNAARCRKRVLDLGSIPRESIPYRNSTYEQCGSDDVLLLHGKIVRPKGLNYFPKGMRAAPTFFCQIWRTIRAELAETLLYKPNPLHPVDFTFRELAFMVVSLAAGLTGTVALVDITRAKVPWDPDWLALVRGDHPDGPSDIVSRTALGYHREGLKPGSAPEATTYWFRNTLIHLCHDLSSGVNVREAAEQSIKHAHCSIPEDKLFHAVLISLEHVVLLRYSSSNIELTEPLGLVSSVADDDFYFSGHWGVEKDKISYHDDDDKSNEDEYEKISKEENVKTKAANEANEGEKLDTKFVPQAVDGVHPEYGLVQTEECKPWCDASFIALVHFMHASFISAMRPEPANEGVFPTEIYREILSFVDAETQRQCFAVSRKFNCICREQIFITEGLKLDGYDESTKKFISWDTVAKKPEALRLCYGASGDEDTINSWGRKFPYRFAIVYGLSTINLSGDTASPRLSFVGLCRLEKYRDTEPWDAIDTPPNAPRSNRLSATTPKPHSTHFWEEYSVLWYIDPDELRYHNFLTLDETRKMWFKICAVYELYFRRRTTAPWQGGLHRETSEYEVKWFYNSEIDGLEVDFKLDNLLHCEFGQPNGFHDVDGTLDCLFQKAEGIMREGLQGLRKRSSTIVFVLLAVDVSAELYCFDTAEKILKPFAIAVEPVTILTIGATASKPIAKCTSAAFGLQELTQRYKDAPTMLESIRCECLTISATIELMRTRLLDRSDGTFEDNFFLRTLRSALQQCLERLIELEESTVKLKGKSRRDKFRLALGDEPRLKSSLGELRWQVQLANMLWSSFDMAAPTRKKKLQEVETDLMVHNSRMGFTGSRASILSADAVISERDTRTQENVANLRYRGIASKSTENLKPRLEKTTRFKFAKYKASGPDSTPSPEQFEALRIKERTFQDSPVESMDGCVALMWVIGLVIVVTIAYNAILGLFGIFASTPVPLSSHSSVALKEALFTAAAAGSSAKVARLLNDGVKPSIRNAKLQTPLHLAAAKGSTETIEVLLRSKDTGWFADDNITPLHLAARNGHIAAVEQLAAIYSHDWHGERATDPYAIEKLKNATAHRFDKHFATFFARKSFTARELAVIYGHVKAVVSFPSAKNDDLRHALSCACMLGDAHTVEEIWLHHERRSYFKKHGSLQTHVRWFPAPPLHLAIISEDRATVAFLLEHGWKPHVQSSGSWFSDALPPHSSPAHYAAMIGSTELLRALRRHGSDADMTALDHRSRTPLSYAVEHLNELAVKYLVDRRPPSRGRLSGDRVAARYLGSGHVWQDKKLKAAAITNERIKEALGNVGFAIKKA